MATAEATFARPANEYRARAVAAMAGGQVVQLPNGRAAVRQGLNAAAAGDPVTLSDSGQHAVIKTAGQVWLAGCPLWWDHSANAATCIPQFADKDFFLGTSVADVASAVVSAEANLNVFPSYIIDAPRGVLGSGGGDTLLVAAAGAPTVVTRGGMLELTFTTTNEAQKVDWLSRRSFPVTANFIAEFLIEVLTAPDNAAVDIDVGVASGTHATDFESVAEFVTAHLDGNDNNIDVQSDDGTTDVAAVDSTIDWAAGTPFLVWIDGRDETNVLIYINGVRVASGSTFTLAAATGPLRLILHMEKTADDSPGAVQVSHAAVRLINE